MDAQQVDTSMYSGTTDMRHRLSRKSRSKSAPMVLSQLVALTSHNEVVDALKQVDL